VFLDYGIYLEGHVIGVRMNKSLYEEAIVDAQRLRELAEETAKNRVVEAVMPQIRDLVNRRILGEQLDDLEDDETDDFAPDEADNDLDVSTDMGFDPAGLSVMPAISDFGDEPEGEQSSVVNVNAQGDVNINVDSDDEDDADDLVLTDTMAEALGRLIRGDSSESLRARAIKETVHKIKNLLETTDKRKLTSTQKRQLNLAFNYCLREALKLHSFVILSEHDTQEKLERNLAGIIKEMRTMAKSNRQNIFDLLFEDEKKGELDEAELVLDLEDEELEGLAAAEDTDAVDVALGDILATVELSLSGDEEADEDVDLEPEPGDEEDLDFGVEEEVAEEGHVYEIDESSLRNELRRMRRLREQEEGRAAEADPSLNHGGEDLGHVILDIDEDDLVNALADELGDPGVSTPTPPGASVGPGRDAMPESYRRRRPASRRPARRSAPRRSRRIAEASRVRRQSAQVGQYRNALSGMKKQLVEMNLFNAKLLYANKLMQNKNLSVKQQRAIVEALDNAKTLREAKLLYKSLSGSLSRRSRGRKLNEGILRTLGSSSRSTRSAQPASSGVEVDRWAVLAGINGND
jgi:hypothetical protein